MPEKLELPSCFSSGTGNEQINDQIENKFIVFETQYLNLWGKSHKWLFSAPLRMIYGVAQIIIGIVYPIIRYVAALYYCCKKDKNMAQLALKEANRGWSYCIHGGFNILRGIHELLLTTRALKKHHPLYSDQDPTEERYCPLARGLKYWEYEYGRMPYPTEQQKAVQQLERSPLEQFPIFY